MNQLLSDDWGVVAGALKEAIAQHRADARNAFMMVAQRYYQHEHDILKNRIFYFDENGSLVEDKTATNIRIPHSFFTELVDQKVQYLLSNPVTVHVEDSQFQDYLNDYWDDKQQEFLQEIEEGASIGGLEYAYSYTDQNDKLRFQTSSGLNTILINNDNGDAQRTVYFTDERVKIGREYYTITSVRLFTDKEIVYFKNNKKGDFRLDEGVEVNPQPHVLAKQGDTLLGRSYNTIPFYKLKNNKFEMSDLKPIKGLIDDFDLMACFLSNNLQDFNDAIYVVTGYPGDDLTKLRQNIKSRKIVPIDDPTGGVEIKTVDIPFTARKAKLDIDREAIYKFGMGLDTAQVGDGNITNVVIKSRYVLLDMKANKAEVRLRSLITWMNKMIVDDINRRFNTAYLASDIKVSIVKESVVDSKELADIEYTEAQTKQIMIEVLLSVASKLDDESILRMICEQLEISYDDVINRLAEQEANPALSLQDLGDGNTA